MNNKERLIRMILVSLPFKSTVMLGSLPWVRKQEIFARRDKSMKMTKTNRKRRKRSCPRTGEVDGGESKR